MDFDIIDGSIAIIAKRKSGKSVLTSYLLQMYHKLFNKIIIISGTESVNQFYSKLPFIDKKFIRGEWDESYINSLIKHLEKINEGKTKGDKSMKHVLLVLDDIMSSFDTHSSKAFKLLFTRGRHYGITVITIQQYITQIPPVCRNNCDYIFSSQQNSESLELLATTFQFGNL